VASRHLIIPDAHAHPDFNNDRFVWLGKLIHDVKPDVVVCIGDLIDHATLCAHAKPLEVERGRYLADLEAGWDAQEKLFNEVRKHKKKQPRWVLTLGNHDIRPQRFVDENPRFQDWISNNDNKFEEFGWEVYPFLEPVRIDGVAYAHYFPSGVLGRPIGGIHPAYSMIMKGHESRTAGHSHLFDYKVDQTPGRSLMGCQVGCYVDFELAYAGQANEMFSSGVVIKDNVEDGLYDIRWIGIDRIKKEYGDGNG